MDACPAQDSLASVHVLNQTDDASKLGHCLHHLLQDAAAKYPTNVALVSARTTLTYRELNEAANRLARVLLSLGIGPHDLVGVALDRSACLVVTLLAVLKTGAAYIPLDATFPSQRVSHMLDIAAPKLLTVSAGMLGAFKSWTGLILSIDEDNLSTVTSEQADSTNLPPRGHSQDLVYVIFTSGSTGKPKGVEINHGALCNLLLSMKDMVSCEAADRMLAVTTVTFDIAALELFMPLLSGATTVIAEQQQIKDAKSLRVLLEREAVTMIQATPAFWQMLLDSGWKGSPTLQKLLCGGEAMPTILAARLLACGGTLWNLYGPTEATVWASAWQVRPEESIIIGKPMANYRLYLLDDEQKPVTSDQRGELYIGGSGLARGYHKNPRLTKASFVDSPFCPGRIYRTGDIGYFTASGRLTILGRADSQIKVRGYRVELGDIEAALASHPEISGAVAVCRTDQLIAYFTRRVNSLEREDKPAGATCPPQAALRKWLDQRLPSYMMPAFFVQLEAFPMTLNNKIDRKALALDPPVASKITPADRQPASVSVSTVSSNASLERDIMTVWTRVLGATRLSLQDNFFHIGGNSLRIVQVQTQLEKLIDRPIPIAKLFEHYSIQSLAAYLGGQDTVGKKQQIYTNRDSSSAEEEDIAIVSMACRLPGNISTPEEFWQLLQSGGDVIGDVPKDRWDASMLEDTGLDTGQCMRGGFLGCIDSFDISLFGISPQEARELDPLQLLTLETCWEGFERAGYPVDKLRGSRTGVYIGVSNMPAHQNFARPLASLNGYTATGSAGATASGRVSHVLGLEGPSLTVDTACSSSLVVTDLACTALRRSECDMAVCCGTTVMLTPGLHVEFSRLGGISRDGRCRAFSEGTDGTGWAEGSVAVVLKRLSRAQRDGDTIHAIVRGSAVNHGGRSAGLTIPSGPAQQRVIRDALTASGLQPSDIDYVEAHGTGTKLGDPIEGAALAQVFGGSRGAESDNDAEPLWLGSAKSNIGHTQAAAGLVGVLKVVLALKHEILPRTLHAGQPTSAVDWQGAGMALVQKERRWVRRGGGSRLRRAGVSSFGIGGTNAHIIVQEAPEESEESKRSVEMEAISDVEQMDSLPFVVSGNSVTAVRQQVESLHRHLSHINCSHTKQLGHVAFSLATSRTHFKHRLVILADSKASLLKQLAANATTSIRAAAHGMRPAMLFTGQASQVPGMGFHLSRTYPVFRQSLETTSQYFSLDRPLLEIMWGNSPKDMALLSRTDFAQPAIFALQVALLSLWRSWGIEPQAVMGHSLGEYAAAYASGVMDLATACRLVQARSRLMYGLPRGGNMVSLEASAAEITAAMGDVPYSGQVGISALNTPTQTVISGDVSATASLAAHIAGRGRKVKVLDVSHAFHSHHIDGMLVEFETVLAQATFHPPQIPIFSCLTGQLADPGLFETPRYWVSQARRAVRFSDAIQAMSSMGMHVFIELGPKPVLSGMGAACLGSDRTQLGHNVWLPSLTERKSDTAAMRDCLAELHKLGASVDWAGYFKPFGYKRVDLPIYAFERKRVLSPTRPLVTKLQNGVDKTTCAGASRDVIASEPDADATDLGSMLRDSSAEQRTALVHDRIARIVADLVGMELLDDVDMDSAWQDIGIDSLMEPQFRSQLVAVADTLFGAPLPGNVTSLYPNLRSLCDHLVLLPLKHRVNDSSTAKEPACRQPLQLDSSFSLDTKQVLAGKLGDNLTFENAVSMQWPPKSVFITGATGFVGAFILQQLLEQGIEAYCLVRASSSSHAMERLKASLARYDLWKEKHRSWLRPIVGDMTKFMFGLSPKAFNELAGQVDAVCHAGALTDSFRPVSDFIGPNIISTCEVLRLASAGRGKAVYFISTSTTMETALEGKANEQHSQHGYRTSKLAAERMVARARSRGAKTCIFRLPLAFASLETGHFKHGRDNFLHCLIVSSLVMKKAPSVDGRLSAWMPVDYLCKTVAAVMTQRPSWLNHDVDFENPQALSLEAVLTAMSAVGERLPTVPLDEWRRAILAGAVLDPTGRFAHLADTLSQFTNQDMLAMLQAVQADVDRHDGLCHGHAWGNDIYPAPTIDEKHLSKYLHQILLDQEQIHGRECSHVANNAHSSGPSITSPALSASAKYPVALSPLRRVLCPSLGFYPPNSRLDRFASALYFFNSVPWCSALINESSPTQGPIPGCGQAVAFVPHCFNPASSRHEQFLGNTLCHGHVDESVNTKQAVPRQQQQQQPPLRHMLSLFRPSDATQMHDPAQPIGRVATLVAFGAGTSGYESIVHGGLIATLLDESLSIINELNSALGKAGCAFGTVHVTASLNIQFLAPVPVATEAVCIATWIDRLEGARTMIRGEMVDAAGARLAAVDSVWAGVGR